jgi:hypothetical protein
VKHRDLPPQGIPVQFFNGGLDGNHGQISDQLPRNFLAPTGVPRSKAWMTIKASRVVFPLSNGRQNLELLMLDFQLRFISVSFLFLASMQCRLLIAAFFI